MSQDDHDHRVRFVYAQLNALVNDLPQIASERDVERYHELIDELEALGYQVSRFRIDRDKDMFRPIANSNSITGRTVYRDHYQVLYGIFARQVKALLTYFEMTQSASHVSVYLPSSDG